MPIYEVTSPDGRTLEIDGPAPPSEAVLAQIFAKMPAPQPQAPAVAPTAAPERTWTDTAVDALPTVGGLVGGIAGMSAGPVGAIGLAALGGAAGERVKQYANAIRGEEALPSQGTALARMAGEGAMQGGAEAIGGVVGKMASKGAAQVYRGYLKPSLSKGALPKAEQIVQTALDEALPITKGGVATAERVIKELRDEVSSILAKTPGSVDLHKIAESVRSFARRKYYKPGASLSSFDDAMAVADRIDAHPSLGIPPGAKPSRVDVPLSKGDEVKRALGDAVGETNFGIKSGATKSAEKVAYNRTRTALEARAAKIAPLNARESKLIDAAKAVAQAVGRESNQQKLYGAKAMAAGAVGGGTAYGYTGDAKTGIATALALRVGFSPAVASRAAIVSHRIAKELGVTAAQAARLTVYALSENQPEQEQ